MKKKNSKRARRIILALLVFAALAIGGAAFVRWQTSSVPLPAPVALANPTPTYDGASARATLFARRSGTPLPEDAALAPTPTILPAPAPNVTVLPAPTSKAEAKKAQIWSQLVEAWASYKLHFIQPDGRVIDPQTEAITTSEGQSYALLRAVWMDDRLTFDKVLGWTQDNLQTHTTGKLFSYKWGQAEDNSWRVLDEASAADADSDIALALVFAARRWNERKYQTLALEVITSIWDKEVVKVQGKPYLTAGDWSPRQTRPALNPSYLSPYAMRIFATLDPAHPWPALVDTSYEVIRGCSENALAGSAAAKLPANWCGIERQTGKLTIAQDYPTLNTNYGYDAFRTMWRVALDYKWFGEKRALDYLTWSDTLRQKWQQYGKLAAEYDYSGNIVQETEDLAVYGGDLANFLVSAPDLAEALVDSKLRPAYKQLPDSANPGHNNAGWGFLQNYYTQNWAWFGLALYADRLPNLADKTPSQTSPSSP